MSTQIVNKQKNTALDVILYYTSAIALPNIFLFNIYNQNRESAQIIFNHILILATVMAVISIIGLIITKLLTKTYEGGLLIILLFWISFWFFESSLNRLPLNSRAAFLSMIVIILICLMVLFRFLSDKLHKGRLIFSALAGVVTLLFVFNAFPIFMTALTPSNTQVENTREVVIRNDFDVDRSLPNPDIYWFHMDGMINFHSMEYYFDEPQDELRNRLLDLGFVINEDAEFVAHNTVFGVPALLSPDLYDSYLHDLFMEGRDLLRRGRHSLLNDAIDRDRISLANDIAPYHQLFHAFLQAGYTTTMIADFDPNVYTPINEFYRLGDKEYPFAAEDGISDRHFLIDALDLIELLSLMTPVPARLLTTITEGHINWQTIPAHDEEIDKLTVNTLNLPHERQVYRALIDLLQTPISQPKLNFMTLMFTHANRWSWQVDGDGDSSRIDLYPIAHEYALNVMLNMIDMILERNPDAIIVIQADHGMHLHPTQRQLLAEGLTEDEVIHLHNSVISAVRIPEQYGGLDTPLDPLNITRELVNRFVGENYELLP